MKPSKFKRTADQRERTHQAVGAALANAAIRPGVRYECSCQLKTDDGDVAMYHEHILNHRVVMVKEHSK